MNLLLSWEDIDHATGGHEGTFNAACPVCGPDRRSGFNKVRKVLRIWRSESDFASYYCARCSLSGWAKPDERDRSQPQRGVLWNSLFPAASMAERARAQEAEALERQKRSAFAEFVWLSADPAAGNLAELYLSQRGYAVADDLRFSPHAPFAYEGERSGPGMIGAVRDAADYVIGCHITHLNPDGTKARRTMFGRVAGGAIRLAPIDDDRVLAVAEGIETALGFSALYGMPCWSALSAPGVAAFIPPPDIKRLVIAPDHDEHGRGLEAAQRLARRARAQCPVVISLPGKAGTDWDDVYRSSSRSAAA